MMEYSVGYKHLKYIFTILIYRGNVLPRDVGQSTILNIKNRLSYVDWCSTGLKCSLAFTAAPVPPWSRVQAEELGVGFISNSSGPGHVLADLVRRLAACSTRDGDVADLEFVECLASARERCHDYVELAMDVEDDMNNDDEY